MVERDIGEFKNEAQQCIKLLAGLVVNLRFEARFNFCVF